MRQPEKELKELKANSLKRELVPHDSSLINFASNDYLGLSRHPRIIEAYQKAIHAYGAGSTASRLICGNLEPHQELEHLLAKVKGTESAITFSTGYATSVGTLTSILQKGDIVILDKLCHASLIDGARMSGATIRVFPHNHLKKLESLLLNSSKHSSKNSRTLVVTESIFSMDGDRALLKEISQLTQRYGALLMVDEAHALGIIGKTGMGLAEELGVQNKIDFHMGTLGKAAGVAGGYIAASESWIELLTNKARSFIYSTAPPPAQAAAATKALQLIASEEGAALRKKLWKNIHYFHELSNISVKPSSAIIPWMVGESQATLDLSVKLKKQGFWAGAVRYPTVPRNTARLRITLRSDHSYDDINGLIACF